MFRSDYERTSETYIIYDIICTGILQKGPSRMPLPRIETRACLGSNGGPCSVSMPFWSYWSHCIFSIPSMSIHSLEVIFTLGIILQLQGCLFFRKAPTIKTQHYFKKMVASFSAETRILDQHLTSRTLQKHNNELITNYEPIMKKVKSKKHHQFSYRHVTVKKVTPECWTIWSRGLGKERSQRHCGNCVQHFHVSVQWQCIQWVWDSVLWKGVHSFGHTEAWKVLIRKARNLATRSSFLWVHKVKHK